MTKTLLLDLHANLLEKKPLMPLVHRVSQEAKKASVVGKINVAKTSEPII